MASKAIDSESKDASAYGRQAQKLSLEANNPNDPEPSSTSAAQAVFITPLDPVIETVGGDRLPAVPVDEAAQLNKLRDGFDSQAHGTQERSSDPVKEQHANALRNPAENPSSPQSNDPGAPFRTAVPPTHTHPLFPPLPVYGPPSLLRNLQSFTFRCTSGVLSLTFLGVIVLGSAFTSIPGLCRRVIYRLTFRDPDAWRPFHEEERRRGKTRKEEARAWYKKRRRRPQSRSSAISTEEGTNGSDEFEPTEGGNDPLKCDVGYYARRVGLEVEEYKVQTEDGFIISLLHLYNPKEYEARPASQREPRGPEIFADIENGAKTNGTISQGVGGHETGQKIKYPILLMPGLLQSAGAYCSNDDDSLAFFLCKSGFDIWIGNNRCGFKPEHKLLKSSDPRMWNWNIRQMGVMDLPALVSRVLSETRLSKIGLICHSQGTTETFVALAKEQRPELGHKISVFCALAPAVYAGPLIGKMYFKFMRIISPNMFRLLFGIHAFIPFMMTMHWLVPGKIYGALGYQVFSYLFNWTDTRWDRGIRNRQFQFSPVYVSAESMRWWLGRECFSTQKCILATREEGQQEDQEDADPNFNLKQQVQGHIGLNGSSENYYTNHDEDSPRSTNRFQSTDQMVPNTDGYNNTSRYSLEDIRDRAWYSNSFPPLALWIAGSDELVDGRRLLRRFEKGREPHVRVVHASVIPEYEHLDVLWAMDSVDKVGREVRDVVWKTLPEDVKGQCQVPKECEHL